MPLAVHEHWVTPQAQADARQVSDEHDPITSLARLLEALPRAQQRGVVRLSVPWPDEPLCAWLAAQTVFPRFYWQARDADSAEYAAIGVVSAAASLAALQAGLEGLRGTTDPPLDYFGGMAFDASSPGWPGYPGCYFFLPRLVLRRTRAGSRLTLTLCFDDRCRKRELAEAHELLQQVQTAAPLPPLRGQRYRRCDSPMRQVWSAWVTDVTRPEQLCQTPKVVLSRETRLVPDEASMPSPWALLERWKRGAPGCFHFAFQPEANETFIGCSPERLYRRDDRELKTEALAGTSPRQACTHDDRLNGQALLADRKNGGENRFVHEDIVNRLAPWTRSLEVGDAHLLKLRSVQHIRRLVQAELHPTTTDQQLLGTLPPTPAVGGVPRDASLDFIHRHEWHPRGWYAGVVGRVSPASAELAVAIRSARLTAEDIRLYAGAGIVEGSQPDEEWRELDAKIADIMALLQNSEAQ